MVTAAALLAVATTACSGSAKPKPHSSFPISLRVSAVDGGEIDLAGFRGRLLVVHLFTTWSLASQVDAEQLIAAHRDHRDQVAIVGIALDPDGHRLVAPWRDAVGVGYLVAVADDAVRQGKSALGTIPEVPITIIYRRDGTVAERFYGPLPPGAINRVIDQLDR